MYQKNKSVGAGEITKEEVAGNVGSILAIINGGGRFVWSASAIAEQLILPK